jgi:hypothetical protein
MRSVRITCDDDTVITALANEIIPMVNSEDVGLRLRRELRSPVGVASEPITIAIVAAIVASGAGKSVELLWESIAARVRSSRRPVVVSADEERRAVVVTSELAQRSEVPAEFSDLFMV